MLRQIEVERRMDIRVFWCICIYIRHACVIRLKCFMCAGTKSEHSVRFVDLSPSSISMLSLRNGQEWTQENITRSFLEFLSRWRSSTVSNEKILLAERQCERTLRGFHYNDFSRVPYEIKNPHSRLLPFVCYHDSKSLSRWRPGENLAQRYSLIVI